MMRVELNGDRVWARLRELGAQAAPMAGETLQEAMETEVMTPSKEICPVDNSDLKNSGHVKPYKLTRGAGVGIIETEAGYGGEAKDYALIQHEALEFVHTVGEAKYLEKPLRAFTGRFIAHVGSRLRARLGL